MNTLVKAGIVVGGGALLLAAMKGSSILNSAKKIDIRVKKISHFKLGTRLTFELELLAENITRETYNIIISGVRIYYNGQKIGSSIPSSKVYTIQPRSNSTISGIKFDIAYVDLLNAIGKDATITTLSDFSKLASKFSYYILLEANGVDIELARQGLGLVSYEHRYIHPKSDYKHLIEPESKLEKTDEVINDDGSVTQTVNYMIDIVKKHHPDVAKLGKELKGNSVKETAKNIWTFIYRYIKYVPDSKLFEQLRRPLRTLHDQKGDCDCYSILAGSILYSLGIPFKFRITKYNGKSEFQHVYVVVPGKNEEIIIDPVVEQFNYQKPYTGVKDFEVMSSLNGMPIQFLNGTGADTAEIEEFINGLNYIEGLGDAQADQALFDYLVKLRKVAASNPKLVVGYSNPSDFIKMLDHAIKNWNTPERDKILALLEKTEDKLLSAGKLQVLQGFTDDDEDLGKIKLKGFFSKVGKALKKGGKAIVKTVAKWNPISMAARAGVLTAFKINFRGMSDKLKAGYLTEEQAKKKGISTGSWESTKKKLAKVEKLWVNTLKGGKLHLKRAILSGKRKSYVKGFEGLGLDPATIAAVGAAAAPLVIKILDMIKGGDEKGSDKTAKESGQSDLPAATDQDESSGGAKVVSSGFFAKAWDFAKENPGKSAVSILAVAYAVLPGFRKSVNGIFKKSK